MTEENSFQYLNHLGLVTQAEKAGEENYKTISKKKEVIRENIEFFKNLIVRKKSLDKNDLIHKPLISIDGSNQQINSVGQIIYVPISIARVYLQSPLFDVKLKNTPYFEKIRILDEDGHAKVQKNENFVKFYGQIKEDIKKVESSVQSNINFLMLKYEAEAINIIADELENNAIEKPSLIFLDGPLIDPPFNSLVSLVRLRCTAYRRLMNLGVSIIGITKRIFQNSYLKHLKKINSGNLKIIKDLNYFFNDFDLMNSIFNFERFNLPLRSNYFNTGKLSLPINSNAKKEWLRYKNEGIDFDSTFFINALGRRVIKIDMLVPEDIQNKIEMYDKIIDAISRLTYPRFSIPLPVYFAHEYANIKIETVELMKKIILSKTASKDPLMLITNPPIDMYDIY
jgi:hypothetical protein